MSMSSGPRQPPVAGTYSTAFARSVSTVAPLTSSESSTISMAGVRPYVVYRYRGASVSSSIQSMPLTLLHGNVVGPGTSTPQCNRIAAGSPHAPVACAFVSRSGWSATLTGRCTVTSAHAGSVASAAGCMGTAAAQPDSSREPDASASMMVVSAVGRRRRNGGVIPFRLPFDA